MLNERSDHYVVAKCSPKEHVFPDYIRLQGLYDIGQQICAMTDVDELLHKIIALIGRSLDLERCLIAKYDPVQRKIIPLKHNISELPQTFSHWPVSRSVVQEVLRTGEAILADDILMNQKLHANSDTLQTKDIKSIICTPLKVGGSYTGVLYVDSSLKKSFSEDDLKFLTALSSYINLALINAEKIAMEKRKRKQLEKRYTKMKNLLIQNNIVGSSKGLRDAFDKLERAACSDVSILLLGERGTGKELFARAAHRLSDSALDTMISLNVAAIPKSIVESELFGYEKDTFTGANTSKPGLIEEANGGTLFLDEIGDMEMAVQSKLLRVLEHKKFRRLGGKEERRSDFRIVCATNRDLKQLTASGKFRADLYDRISDIPIKIPALCDRKDDIPELLDHFLQSLSSEKTFAREAVDYLTTLPWEGNVRQLFKVVKRADVLCENHIIEYKDIGKLIDDNERPCPAAEGVFPTLKQLEKEYIEKALKLTRNVNKAAQLLGIGRSTLFKKKNEYGLK